MNIYAEDNPEEFIFSINYDPIRHKVIMLLRHGSKPDDTQNIDHRIFHLKIFDIRTNKI